MTRWTKVFALAALAVLMTALPAKACSCAPIDARDAIQGADGAFVGTVVSRTPDPADPVYSAIFRFSVEEAFKGEIGDTVDVYTSADGASCGLEIGVGGRTGLFLYMSEGKWTSHLCAMVDPEQLRAAAEPLPEPDGEGPIQMLVSGSWGEVGIYALDSEGRTLAYGLRENGQSEMLQTCPGSERFLEVHRNTDDYRPKLAVRDMATQEVIREVPIPFGRGDYRYVNVVSISCANAAATTIYIAGMRDGAEKDYVFELKGDNKRRIYSGKVGGFHFEGTDLWVFEGGRGRYLVHLDLAERERDGVATVPAGSREPRISPNGKWIVMTAGSQTGKLVRVNRATGNVKVESLGAERAGEAVWIDNDTIAFLAGGLGNSEVELFDRDLERISVLEGIWYTNSNALIDGVAYGIGWGTLYRAPLPGGPVETLRTFDSPNLHFIEAVPEEVFAAPSM